MQSSSVLVRLGIALALGALPAAASAGATPQPAARTSSPRPTAIRRRPCTIRNGANAASSAGSREPNRSTFGSIKGPHVHLHQGTVINPTGITLQPHMHVEVFGHWNDNGPYHADRIDVLPR